MRDHTQSHDNTTRQSKEAAILNHRRLIKTGAAALIATAIFAAVVAFLAAGWTKSPMRDVVAATPRSDAANAAASSSNPAASVTKIIPQVVIGSFDGGLTRYSTVVEVVNTGNTEAAITAAFYKEDGNLSPVPMTTNVEGHTTFAGRIDSLTLPAGRGLIISAGNTAVTTTAGMLGWGKVTATGTISISAFFEVRAGATNVLSSRIGVAASRPDLSSFVIPRVHTRNGLDVAFAIVNTGANPASITATLKDTNGATLAKRTMSMSGGTHQALFAHQFFSLPAEATDLDYQYIVFNSDSPSFAAMALAFENGTQTSFPVDPLQ